MVVAWVTAIVGERLESMVGECTEGIDMATDGVAVEGRLDADTGKVDGMDG